MIDAAGRTIDYMRISITDRCNLRCRYCMPDGITQVAMSEILTYEEIKKICTLAEELGIGEPTLVDIVKELEKPGRDPREKSLESRRSRLQEESRW